MLSLFAFVGPVIHDKLIKYGIFEQRSRKGLVETDLFGIANYTSENIHSALLLTDLHHPSTKSSFPEDSKDKCIKSLIYQRVLPNQAELNGKHMGALHKVLRGTKNKVDGQRVIFSQSTNIHFKPGIENRKSALKCKPSFLSSMDEMAPSSGNTTTVSILPDPCTDKGCNENTVFYSKVTAETNVTSLVEECRKESFEINQEKTDQEQTTKAYTRISTGCAFDNTHCGNFYLNPPDYNETAEWEKKLYRQPRSVQEFFSHKREFREALAFCDPPVKRETNFSTKTYSFNDQYKANFSTEDWAQYHAWENYQMDYMGSQCSDNIIEKLNQSLIKEADHPHTYLPNNNPGPGRITTRGEKNAKRRKSMVVSRTA